MQKNMAWLALMLLCGFAMTVTIINALGRADALGNPVEIEEPVALEVPLSGSDFAASQLDSTKAEAQTETVVEFDWVPCSETENQETFWEPDVVSEYANAYGTIMVVDLANQHAYCCVDGVVIADADCVSGDLYNSPTPTGLYSVWYKCSDFYMLDSYYSAYAVFFNDGIAIHDADAWRSEYGGSIYQWDGSHGCINTPSWFAEIVYNNTDIGTPVYVF